MRVLKLLVQNKEVQNEQHTKTLSWPGYLSNNDLGFFLKPQQNLFAAPSSVEWSLRQRRNHYNQISGSNGACG